MNAVGTVQKWLFGTMDDQDRQDIFDHLKITDENNRNAIKNLNNQIKINMNYNQTLSNLKLLIANDRVKISKALSETNQYLKDFIEKILFMDQEIKLRYIQTRINQILDNIVSTKNNIIHPSMFTLEELEEYKIDFHKLKLLKAGLLKYDNELLIFAIKIPRDYILTDLELITGIPNSNNYEIKDSNELIVKVNEKIYKYKENSMLKDIKLSENCIVNKNCKLKFNNVSSIDEIDDETILLKNMKNEILEQNCNKRKFVLKGNYLINFSNCTIKIKNRIFENAKFTILDKYFYPAEKINSTIIKPINFEEITINNTANIQEIKELQYHKKITQGTNIGIIVVLIAIIGIIIFKNFKEKKQTIKIVNNSKPESFDLKGGGVTYLEPDKSKISDLSDHHVTKVNLKPSVW